MNKQNRARRIRRMSAMVAIAGIVTLAAAGALVLAKSCDDGEVRSVVPTPATSSSATAGAGTPASGETPSASATATNPRPAVVPEGYAPERAFPNAAFSRMIALEPIPGDESHAAVATQMEGVIYRISLTDATEAPTVFLDLSDRLINSPANEEGLLGLAFSPHYEEDGRFYVAYSAGGPRRNTVARYTADGDAADPTSGRVILEVEDFAGNHNGGALEFGPDGYLYVALGDGGGAGDPRENGQNLDTLLGKILRLDVSGDAYTVPSNNPFVGSGAGEIWAYGLRNPWRFTFDRETGDIWAGDVGQGSWEEVNRIERGGNYGWSIMEGYDCFDGGCDRSSLITPRAVYATHEGSTCAITGGYVYRGTRLPELVGWYVYADYCSGHVWALDTADPAAAPVLLMDTDHSISSFAEDPAGEVYLITFGDAIFSIVRATP